MTPERFRQIRNLFEAALERDAPLRSSFLAEACQGDEPLRAEVGRLLSAHEKQAALLDREAVRPELLTGEAGKMEGRRIDHFEILRELGRGGMGSVYLAVRTDGVYRKPVAFKVVRPDAGNPEVIERFRREREILASLDHPNIARLIDGGTTPEGLPYFVMDYVEGRPIDAYCDERQMNVTERLRLFRSVCAAVEYAHGRGVVHRDLKPGNVLVTAEGVPKLLDFGIAKLLRSEEGETAAHLTGTGMHLMTPEYASPEQVRGEAVSTASDIYSLGVILYELLTGHRPYRMRSRLIHEIVRVICEQEPTRPSTAVTETEQRLTPGNDKPVAVTPQSVSQSRADTPAGLRRQLSGDPDRIILKALRKDPALRYPNPEAFSEDIRRHLERLPVLAEGESIRDRAWKLLQPYQGWLAAAGVLVAALLTGKVKVQWSPLLGWAIFACWFFYQRYKKREEEGAQAWKDDFDFGNGFGIPLVLILCVVWGIELAMFARFFLGRPHHNPNSSMFKQSGQLFLPCAFLYFGALLARWSLRDRWAGPLMLDARQPQRKSSLFIFVGFTALVILDFLDQPSIYTLFDFVSLIWVYALFKFAFESRVEVRPRGFVFVGGLVPWTRIKSYAWGEVRGDRVRLILDVDQHWYRILLYWRTNSIQLKMLTEEKPAVDSILRRQRAEWPSSQPPPRDEDYLLSALKPDEVPYYQAYLSAAPHPVEIADYVARCPKCHSPEIVFQNLDADPPGGSVADAKFNWSCDACGHRWQDDGNEEKY